MGESRQRLVQEMHLSGAIRINIRFLLNECWLYQTLFASMDTGLNIITLENLRHLEDISAEVASTGLRLMSHPIQSGVAIAYITNSRR